MREIKSVDELHNIMEDPAGRARQRGMNAWGASTLILVTEAMERLCFHTLYATQRFFLLIHGFGSAQSSAVNSAFSIVCYVWPLAGGWVHPRQYRVAPISSRLRWLCTVPPTTPSPARDDESVNSPWPCFQCAGGLQTLDWGSLKSFWLGARCTASVGSEQTLASLHRMLDCLGCRPGRTDECLALSWASPTSCRHVPHRNLRLADSILSFAAVFHRNLWADRCWNRCAEYLVHCCRGYYPSCH